MRFRAALREGMGRGGIYSRGSSRYQVDSLRTRVASTAGSSGAGRPSMAFNAVIASCRPMPSISMRMVERLGINSSPQGSSSWPMIAMSPGMEMRSRMAALATTAAISSLKATIPVTPESLHPRTAA